MGRFDALTQLEENKEKKTPSPVVSSSTPIKPPTQPVLRQYEVVKKPENQKSKKPEADPQPTKQSQFDKSVRPYVRAGDTAVRTDKLLDLIPPTPDKRRPERYAFQFWEDQITRLKQLRKVMNLSKDADAREEVSLSDMIREAVDDYIHKQIFSLTKVA
jgi:hypothetical protein